MEDINARIVIKQANGLPTIPVSLDPRNGDWLDTDIFEGEMYQDLDTGKVYTRDANGITDATGKPALTTYKAVLTQGGVIAPAETKVFEDDLEGVWSYVGVGIYRYTKTGAFAGTGRNLMFVQIQSNLVTSSNFNLEKIDSDVIELRTYDATDTLANGILEDASILIQF
jgi:hypothetical protein